MNIAAREDSFSSGLRWTGTGSHSSCQMGRTLAGTLPTVLFQMMPFNNDKPVERGEDGLI